ncbi:hypothetical protein EK904_003020 [Melospiza melodia maxima]|nr:hypothetical protein EK904_003020 [Melospiza melodia maxima]
MKLFDCLGSKSSDGKLRDTEWVCAQGSSDRLHFALSLSRCAPRWRPLLLFFRTDPLQLLFSLRCVTELIVSYTYISNGIHNNANGSSKSSHSLSLSCVSLAGRDGDEGPQTRGCGVAETVLELPPRGREVTDIELTSINFLPAFAVLLAPWSPRPFGVTTGDPFAEVTLLPFPKGKNISVMQQLLSSPLWTQRRWSPSSAGSVGRSSEFQLGFLLQRSPTSKGNVIFTCQPPANPGSNSTAKAETDGLRGCSYAQSREEGALGMLQGNCELAVRSEVKNETLKFTPFLPLKFYYSIIKGQKQNLDEVK